MSRVMKGVKKPMRLRARREGKRQPRPRIEMERDRAHKFQVQLDAVASAPVLARASLRGVSPTRVQIPGAQLRQGDEQVSLEGGEGTRSTSRTATHVEA